MKSTISTSSKKAMKTISSLWKTHSSKTKKTLKISTIKLKLTIKLTIKLKLKIKIKIKLIISPKMNILINLIY